jgi:2-polyprenyl-3-methyl-5-hydroxy-6-metoxy-1,4-benzoquinol methylase
MASKNVTLVRNCRICNSKDLIDVLNLGDQPIPNGFLSEGQLKEKEKKYPLAVVFCKDCSLMQLKYLVNPKVMFKNYLYIPSASKTRVEYFKKMAEQVIEVGKLNEGDLVIDVGSNDGSLLICFRNLGMKILGIDPAENLATVAALNGVYTEVGYFDSKLAKKVVKKYRQAKAITATNVIAHIQNLHEVLKGGEILLEKEGIFVMHFPYSLDLLKKNLFDTIYHEHLSYFSIKSLLRLAELSGLEVFDIKKSDLDGGSLRVFWKKRENHRLRVNTTSINKLLKEEKDFGLHDTSAYEKFEVRVKRLKSDSNTQLAKLKEKDKSIVGYGAAAKANVLLNYFNLNTKAIEYIVDSTPYKQGLYTPGTHIPIYPEDKIYETKPDYILIFAWNFSKEIMDKNKKYKGKFIVVEPEFKVL